MKSYTVKSTPRTFTWPLYQKVPWWRRLLRIVFR
jgi:hypothetical protein